MKRQSWAKALIIITSLALVSCASNDANQSILTKSKEMAGLEAALAYENEMINNDSVKLLYNAAYSYIEAVEYEKALSLIEQGIEKYPEYLRFHYLKAYVYRETDQAEDYRATLENIISINPADIKVLELLLDVYSSASLEDLEINTAKTILSYQIANQKALDTLAKYSDFFKIYEKTEIAEDSSKLETEASTEEKEKEETSTEAGEKEETPTKESPDEVNP